jgi:uncharacterized protein (TIGR02145 family)
MMALRSRVGALACAVALGLAGASCSIDVSSRDRPGAPYASERMADGVVWMTSNLSVNTAPSWCYGDTEANCRRYARLYTWEAAQRACQSLGNGWRLPSDDDWRQMAKHYGGVHDDSDDRGQAAYHALVSGGSSGFDALFGGGRAAGNGQYDDLEAHGFYWTASEIDRATAWFYNFGRGGPGFYRQSEGEKPMALSVRCVGGPVATARQRGVSRMRAAREARR